MAETSPPVVVPVRWRDLHVTLRLVIDLDVDDLTDAERDALDRLQTALDSVPGGDLA